MITRAHAVLVLLIVLLVSTISAFTPSDARAQDRTGVARPISSFGLDVFRHVASTVSEPNVVFSPLSVGLAIALLAEGSTQETRTELQAALGTSDESWQAYQRDIHALLTDLNGDTTAVTRIASSLWADEGRRLRQGFVEIAQRVHLATVRSVDLQADATADLVNDWAREKTNGRIADVMPPPRPSLALILLNAVYFNGQWELPFDSARTKPASFVRAGADTIQVPTMVRRGGFGHFEHDGERGLRIPYRGGRYAAYVVVPGSVSVQHVVANLTVSDVDGWNTRARGRPTNLHLPRMEHRGRWPLLGALAKAGVPRVVGEHAQLDAIWAVRQEGPTEVNDASQATFLKIDEEGTEAAAVTAVQISVTTVPPPPVAFRVDAPFVFVIRDEATGALMFVAQVGDPSDSGGG